MFRITKTNKMTTKPIPDFLIGSLVETEETLWTLARKYRGIGAESTDGETLIIINPDYGKWHYLRYRRIPNAKTTDSRYWTFESQHSRN